MTDIDLTHENVPAILAHFSKVWELSEKERMCFEDCIPVGIDGDLHDRRVRDLLIHATGSDLNTTKTNEELYIMLLNANAWYSNDIVFNTVTGNMLVKRAFMILDSVEQVPEPWCDICIEYVRSIIFNAILDSNRIEYDAEHLKVFEAVIFYTHIGTWCELAIRT